MDDDDWEDLELDHAPEQYETTPGSQATIPRGGPPDPTAVVGDSEVKPEGADTAEDGDDDNLSDGLADEPICRICLSGEDERDLGVSRTRPALGMLHRECPLGLQTHVVPSPAPDLALPVPRDGRKGPRRLPESMEEQVAIVHLVLPVRPVQVQVPDQEG